MSSLRKRKTEPLKRPVVYVGPGFRDSRLSTYAIFADGVPDEYSGHPILQHLFVEPERLDEARQQVREKGSMLNTMFSEAVKEHKKTKGGK